MREEPYFMKNKAWYYYDDNTDTLKLTKLGKSIPKVVKSYEKYYKPILDEDGEIMDA